MFGDEVERYISRSRKRWIAISAVIIITIAISVYSVCVMSFNISFTEAWEVIIRHLQGI